MCQPVQAQTWGAPARAQSSEIRAAEHESDVQEIGDMPRHVLILVFIPPDDT